MPDGEHIYPKGRTRAEHTEYVNRYFADPTIPVHTDPSGKIEGPRGVQGPEQDLIRWPNPVGTDDKQKTGQPSE